MATLFIPPSRVTDSNNQILSGAKAYFYASGTLSLQTVYSNDTLSVALSNPVVANSGGKFPSTYLDPALDYRCIVKDSSGNLLDDIDPLPSDYYLTHKIDILNQAIALGTVSTLVGVEFATKALMDADLAHAAGVFALVYQDSTATNNDLYVKTGASGTGSWSATGIFNSAAAAYAASAAASAVTAASLLSGPTTISDRLGRPVGQIPYAIGPSSANTFILKDAATHAGTSIDLEIYAYGDGTVKIKRFTKSGSTYTFVAETSVSVIPGINRFPGLAVTTSVNDYFGYYGTAVGYDNGGQDGSGYDYIAGDNTTSGTGTDLNTPNGLTRLLVGISVNRASTDSLINIITANKAIDAADQCVSKTERSVLEATARGVSKPVSNVPTLLTNGGWNGVFVYGQSLAEGYSATPIISTTQPYSNLTFGSGPRSGKSGNTQGAGNTSPGTSTTIALIEATGNLAEGGSGAGETICSSTANGIVTRSAKRGYTPSSTVVFASTPGRGGYKISQLNKGTSWYNQLLDHANEMKARAVAAGKSYQFVSIPWLQGESDAVNVTSRATYLSALTQLATDMNTDLKAISGQTTDIHTLTYQTGSSATATLSALNSIQLAQLDAARNSSLIHLVSPIYHLANGSTDGIHLPSAGQWLLGRYMARAVDQMLWERRVPDRIEILSATAKSTTLTILFDVPAVPLVLDTTLLGPTTDKGFKVIDDTGTLTLSNIAVGSDGRSVTMTLNRTLGTNPKVRYALDYLGTGVVFNVGASGNLRDSTSDTVVCPNNSMTYQLFHVCPHFEQAIVILENI